MSDTTLSLYFQLKEDRKADLEVVANASLHWVAALRAAATAIEPDAEIRVEFINAEQGSLRLNTILEWTETQLERLAEGSADYPRLRSLAVALSFFIGSVPAADFIKSLYSDSPAVSLDENDRLLLQELIEHTQEEPEVESKGRKFFGSLEQDPGISGVGVSEDSNSPPALIVPSKEFAERSGLWTLQEDEDERISYAIQDVTLIKPVLIPKRRAWTFSTDALGEFNAVMSDERFLHALEHNQIKEPLRSGIRMRVQFKVEEKKVDGVWTLKRGGRSIVKVLSPEVD